MARLQALAQLVALVLVPVLVPVLVLVLERELALQLILVGARSRGLACAVQLQHSACLWELW